MGALKRMLEAHTPDEEERIFCEEVLRAAASIKALEWDAIRQEKFTLTPVGLYSELVRNAEFCPKKACSITCWADSPPTYLKYNTQPDMSLDDQKDVIFVTLMPKGFE